MFATTNSRVFLSRRRTGRMLWGLVIVAYGWAVAAARGEDETNPVFLKRAEKAFLAAKGRMEAEKTNEVALWQFGRAAYDWADLQTADARKSEIAKEGIAACQRLIAENPASAEGHYYLGMDMGELAETETLGALKLVRQMESEFKLVQEKNAKLDNAGPERNLGLLYRDAPGWPTSIGNREKAREHLQKAYELAPSCPENLMNIVESELKWDETAKAARDMRTLEELWPKAQKEFAGEEWEVAWADWTKRREAAAKKLSVARHVATSPHGQEQPGDSK